MIPHNRGRGGYPYRGGRGRGQYPLIQQGSNRLIAKNVSSSSVSSSSVPIPGDPLYEDFQKYLKEKGINNPPSYTQAITEGDNIEDTSEYIQSPYKEEILLLENKDVMLYFENNNDHWFLMTRYFDTATYTTYSYKSRTYYENILISTGSVDFSHFKTGHNMTYNFSKAIIKRIISAEDWGLSTLREKELTMSDSKTIVKFTYWDYIESFHKTFLYENPNKKHSWFFKVCENVYKQNIPIWFIKWWISYGPSIDILPEHPFRILYGEWLPVSPKYKEAITHIKGPKEVIEVISSLHFFNEFSIPWIWKWEPLVDYSPDKIPSLRRTYFTKFWPKMLQIDPATKRSYAQDTLDLLQKKIQEYKGQQEFTSRTIPFKLIQNTKESNKLSKEEMIKAYLDQMKEDLKQLQDDDNISMASVNSQNSNSYQILAGESQPEEDSMPVEDMLSIIETQLLKNKTKEDSYN